jgi:hypothetical protein
MLTILGIILVVAGALIIAYHGFSYKKNQKIAQVGDLKVSANAAKSVYLSPTAGGIVIAVGILFLLLG